MEHRKTLQQAIGQQAENAALDYLKTQGLQLVQRNFRCRGGEIDLIMRDGSALVFVEVRYRRSNRFGSGAETVTSAKQRRIALAAARYLQDHRRFADSPARFDVVSASPATDGLALTWIRDAFIL